MKLIDYDKLYHAVMDTALSSTDEDVIFDLMDSSTVDAVPVIRCRDCGNWKPTGSRAARNIEDPLEQLGGCEIMRIGRLESDFCSCGKEKKRTADSAPLNQEERWLKTV